MANNPAIRSGVGSTLGEAARLIGWLLLPLAVGGISGWLTAGAIDTWYRTLQKPVFNPPDWLFGPVWTVLYLMMGLAAYLALRAARRGGDRVGGRSARRAFLVQLALNGLWSLLFFGLQSPGIALAQILVLWAAIGITVARFAPLSKLAAGLLMPYWAWVSFAAMLNGSIWWLNR